jgi:hypothetical protein
MTRRLLLILSSDPCLTGRPAEAVRLAAGISACGQVQVRIYLHGPAAKTLAPEASDALDMDLFVQYWPLVASPHAPILVQAGALQQYRLAELAVPTLEISRSELIAWIGVCDSTIHFDASPGAPLFDGPELLPPAPRLTPSPTPPNLPLLLFSASPDFCPPVVFDLTAPSLDYPRLLREIFRAAKIATL